MKKLVVLFVSLSLAFVSLGAMDYTKGIDQKRDDKPYHVVDVLPKYQGGESAMMKFIQDNVKYPVKAVENGVSGRVVVRFVVDKDGSISDVVINKGLSKECDAEAMRVIKAMPKWIPGKNKGENVAVYYNLPIIFNLMKKEKTTK